MAGVGVSSMGSRASQHNLIGHIKISRKISPQSQSQLLVTPITRVASQAIKVDFLASGR